MARLSGTLPALNGSALTALPAANLTGTIAAISGVNLTALNATQLTSGTVPTARLGSGTANSGVFLRGDGTWDTAGSTSASDLTSGTLPMARLSGTLPALNGSNLTNLTAGKVLQVVMTTDNSAVSLTDGQEYTALSTAITPSATSSKVLVMVTFGLVSTTAPADTGYEIRRNSTDLQQGTGGSINSTYGLFMNEIAAIDAINASSMLLDSPSTTSATTYKIISRPNSTHGLVINQRSSSSSSLKVSSSMILMEIGA
jgi:hypothetical protein